MLTPIAGGVVALLLSVSGVTLTYFALGWGVADTVACRRQELSRHE